MTHPPEFVEDIRLIIWDLDETFWQGTLSEGGITYCQAHHDLVITLAQRGIMSTICSKNNHAEVQAALEARGLWRYFIFPSIDWTAKGPRIAAMLDQIGLRAPSVLFIDDLPMNRAQAAAANSGLNTAGPEIIPLLAEAPQLRGKADRSLTRLAQYQIKEAKSTAQRQSGGDSLAFLRQSDVRLFFDYDVEAGIDRAVELINRTNQLNFTKNRLPDDPAQARAALRKALAHNTVDAALIRAQDAYGDYGFIGFYLTRREGGKRRLEHFCFSCRTLGMYIEHWVYRHLGRPALTLVGAVITNPKAVHPDVDWIRAGPIDQPGPAATPALHFDQIIARGGCDLASLMHYLALHAGQTTEEFNQPKGGQMLRRDHSAFLLPALTGGLSGADAEAAALLGYEPADFTSALAGPPQGGTLYLLSFWADADIPLYRHRGTGLCLPYWLVGAQGHDLIARSDLRAAVARTDLQRTRLATLCADFEHIGILPADEMQRRYAQVLDALPRQAPVAMMLANERGPLHFVNPAAPPHAGHAQLNQVLRRLAGERGNVILVDPAAQITGAEDLLDLNHFKRAVYHGIYRDLRAALCLPRAA